MFSVHVVNASPILAPSVSPAREYLSIHLPYAALSYRLVTNFINVEHLEYDGFLDFFVQETAACLIWKWTQPLDEPLKKETQSYESNLCFTNGNN